MSKKIHTIQSSDKKEFDERVNLFLNVDSVELMEGSYEVIKKDGVVVYSQVVVIDQSKMDIDFFDNGQKEHEGTYKDGKKDGKWTYWHKNGKKKFEGTYKNGELDLYTEYFESWEELLKWAGSDDDDNSTGEPDSQNETDSKE